MSFSDQPTNIVSRRLSLCSIPNQRAGNHHFTALPTAIRLHQQSASQPQVELRGLCRRINSLRSIVSRCDRGGKLAEPRLADPLTHPPLLLRLVGPGAPLPSRGDWRRSRAAARTPSPSQARTSAIAPANGLLVRAHCQSRPALGQRVGEERRNAADATLLEPNLQRPLPPRLRPRVSSRRAAAENLACLRDPFPDPPLLLRLVWSGAPLALG